LVPDKAHKPNDAWGKAIVKTVDSVDKARDAVLSLIFAKGQRPTAEAVAALQQQDGTGLGFAISHRPPADEGWLELLARGLTFDCRGLAPAPGAPFPRPGTLLGLQQEPAGEALALMPGPHLAEGRGLLPVVRILAGLGAVLSELPGVLAVSWNPAGSWMAPEYFRKRVSDWLGGGAFPALGLTTLKRESNGAMVSQGLELLIGQELRFEPDADLAPAQIARIAVRMIHELIERGPLTEADEFAGPDDEPLLAVPVHDGMQLRVMVRR
jgi:hypothetical protein